MKLKNNNRSNSAATLLELMVSISIGMFLVLIVASMTSSASIWSTGINAGLTTRRDGKVVLDYFERDLNSVIAVSRGRSSFALVPETVEGQGGVSASSVWIMLLTNSWVNVASRHNNFAVRK